MRKDVLHIHINKCAGTSIRSGMMLLDQPRHQTALEWRRRLPCCFDDAFVFAFVRNPYSRVVSSYEYKRRMNYDCINMLNASFDEWVKAVYLHRAGPMFTHSGKDFRPCYWWLSDEEGNIMVDNIYKYENFAAELDRLKDDMRRHGIERVNFNVPHMKVNPDPKPLEEYYQDPETLAIITDFFAIDFATFGYEKELIPEDV